MGRLANHSVVEVNMKPNDVIVFVDNNQRYVVLRASKTIHLFPPNCAVRGFDRRVIYHYVDIVCVKSLMHENI